MNLRPSVPGTTLLILAACSLAVADDWPAWRGPNNNGVSKETGFSTTWTGEPKVLWRAKVGLGYSSFAVVDGRAYTLGWDGGKDHVHCFDAASGKKLWTHSYPCPKFDKYHPGGTGATPTVHEGRVYTLSKQGDLFCLDAKTGEVQWNKQLKKELGVEPPTWGFSGSPIIEGDGLIVDAGTVASFNHKTGEVLWKSKAMPVGYATPVAFTHGGRRLLAVFNAEGLALLAAADGQAVTAYPWKTKYDVNAGTPIVAGDHIFISSGYGKGAALLRLRDGTLEKVWENQDMKNQMNPCVLVGEALYGFDGDQKQPSTQLTCMDFKTGKVHWKRGGLGAGALMAAGDHLIITSETGELVIAAADPSAYKELARGQVLGGTNWTAPVLSNGRIYCRNDRGDVACVDVQAKGALR